MPRERTARNQGEGLDTLFASKQTYRQLRIDAVILGQQTAQQLKVVHELSDKYRVYVYEKTRGWQCVSPAGTAREIAFWLDGGKRGAYWHALLTWTA